MITWIHINKRFCLKNVVNSISFQTFLYRHLKMVVDSWNFSMLSKTKDLMRWLTNFYDFRFKWTATAAIGIHPTKSWLSQLGNFKNAIWTLEERYAIKLCFKTWKNTMQWKLDLLLWPRDQETEIPVEACWLSQTQGGQTEQIQPETFDDPFFFFFWQHWHDLHALGSHWTDSQQGIKTLPHPRL